MRFSTVVSFLIAVILAGLAVYGAQTWLASERQSFAETFRSQLVEEEVAPERSIVVASESISFGEIIDGTKVREIEWASEFMPEGSFSNVSDLVIGTDDDNARFALTSIQFGEPILLSKVTAPGQRAKLSTALTPGMKAISIRVNDVLGVSGFVLPGDRVDVLLTRRGGGGSFVDVLLQGVKVLAIDQTTDDRKDKPSVVRTVTFEVNTLEAQKLTLAANVGTLSLALRNVASSAFENIERVRVGDLSDTDIAEDLIDAASKAENGDAAGPDPSIERMEKLEQLLKSLSEGMSAQIQGVEEKINSQEPVIVEKEVVVEKVVERKPIIPISSTVGVIRNGTRNEYKVKDGSAEEPEADGNQAPESVE